MNQINVLKGELEEKMRQISALLNTKILKIDAKIHHVLYKIPYLRGNLEKYRSGSSKKHTTGAP